MFKAVNNCDLKNLISNSTRSNSILFHQALTIDLLTLNVVRLQNGFFPQNPSLFDFILPKP